MIILKAILAEGGRKQDDEGTRGSVWYALLSRVR